MDIRVNNVYLPSQLAVEKTPTMVLVAGALSILVGLMLFRDISYYFCGAGVLAIALSRLSPHRFKTRVCLYSLLLSAIVLTFIAFFVLKNTPLALSAASLGALALMQAKKHKIALMASLILMALAGTLMATSTLINFETAKALTIVSGGVFLFSAAVVVLQKKKTVEEIVEELKGQKEIEVDEAYGYAAFQEWLLKHKVDAKELEGKPVIYKNSDVTFVFKAPQKITVDSALECNSKDFAPCYAQSHGCSIEQAQANIAANESYGDQCLILKVSGTTVGGAFYRLNPQGPTLVHTLSRLPYVSGTKVIKKVVAFLKAKGHQLWIQVYEDNPALELYKKEGFKVQNRSFDRNGCFFNMILI